MATHRTDGAPSLASRLLRASDRLWTPLTVSVAMVLGFLTVAGVVVGELWAREHGYPAGTVIQSVRDTLTALGVIAGAAYLRGQRQQLSRVEVGVNKPTD